MDTLSEFKILVRHIQAIHNLTSSNLKLILQYTYQRPLCILDNV